MAKLKEFQASLKEIVQRTSLAAQMLGGIKVCSGVFDKQIAKIQNYLSKCDEIATDDNIKLWTSQGAKSLTDWCDCDRDFKENYGKAVREQNEMRQLCEETVGNYKKFHVYYTEASALTEAALTQAGKLLAYYKKNKKTEKLAEMEVAWKALQDKQVPFGELKEEVEKLKDVVVKCKQRLGKTRGRVG